MATKYHTIIFVPHARARFRKFKLSNRLVVGGFALLGAGLVLSAYFSLQFFGSISEHRELSRLQRENAQLRTVNTRFESSMTTLQQQLRQFDQKTRQLALIAGVTDGLAAAGGVGGVPGDPFAAVEGASASLDPERLGQQLDALAGRFERQAQTLAHTPSVAPTRGILTNGFGMRRDPFDGGADYHQALDISAAPGSPILAPADGLVTKAQFDGSYGNCVDLAHGYGYTTRFGHMMRFNCKVGQRVKRGEIIGYVGSTGRSTGPHLHYEVRVDNKPVNPLAYILN